MSWEPNALAVALALAACGSPAEPQPEVVPQAEAEGREAERIEVAAPSTEDEPEEPAEHVAATAPEGEPTVFTSISFDLRGMPHRGPRDVDPASITSRVEYLMQQTRDAAGEPTPRLLYNPGISVFRAEFFGPAAEALAQCNRATAEVAPVLEPGSRSRRAALRAPEATPCAPTEAE
ncbi:MAG: hypothetical protein DRJ42_28325 [Deltaproteobacteria bacterium]|nr:MAG: hypothetical protein DRJ42_28325 [Deltaproteobacteria bacterium]